MTEQEWDALPAREKDAAVAVARGEPMPEKPPVITGHVSTLTLYEPNGTNSWGLGFEDGEHCWVPFPFTEKIETAWELAEEMTKEGFDLICEYLRPEQQWWFAFCKDGEQGNGGDGDTAPLALSLAYMKAKGAIE